LFLSVDFFGSDISIFLSAYHGLRCFLGFNPPLQDHEDDAIAMCEGSLLIIIGYVLSTFTVIASINSVLTIGNQIIGRAVEGSVLAAFIVLWFYDYLIRMNHSIFLSCHVSICDILVIAVLLAGMEVYSQDPEPDVELITNYPATPNSPAATPFDAEPITPTYQN
jgi:hypothetical protein